MKNQLGEFIPVIDGRKEDWEKRAAELYPTGLNFVVALPNDHSQIEHFCAIIGLPSRHLPGPLLRWEVFGLHRHICPEDFNILKERLDASEPIYFVEAILLPIHRSGKLKPWLIVDELRGIVEDHDTYEEARKACHEFSSAAALLGSYPEASVYRWSDVEWHSTRSCG